MNFFILIRTKCSLIRPNFSNFSGGGCYSSIRVFGPQTPTPPSYAKKPVYESGQGWKSRNVELATLYTHNSVLSLKAHQWCQLSPLWPSSLSTPLHSPPLFTLHPSSKHFRFPRIKSIYSPPKFAPIFLCYRMRSVDDDAHRRNFTPNFRSGN